MKNYKILMLTTIFALASSLDAMPPKKSEKGAPTSTTAVAVPKVLPVDVSLAGVAAVMDRNTVLEKQVSELLDFTGKLKGAAQGQKDRADRLAGEVSALTATHGEAIDAKDVEIERINVAMGVLREDTARTGTEKDDALATLGAEKEALESEKAAIKTQHDDLLKGLSRFSVADEQRAAHAESNRRVQELLADSDSVLAALRKGLPESE